MNLKKKSINVSGGHSDNKPLRIAFTSGNLIKDSDGVARVVYKTIAELLKHGAVLRCISQLVPPKGDLPVDVVSVPSFAIPLRGNYRIAYKTKSIVKKTLDEFMPDIIHVHTPDAVGITAAKYGIAHNIPVIATHHTQFDNYLKYYNLQWLEPLLWKYLKNFYSKCALILCPSSEIENELNKHGIKNTTTLNHGVDTSVFKPNLRSSVFRKTHYAESKLILLFVGQLVWYKDLDILADAYKIFSGRDDVLFMLAGSGPAKKELKKRMPKAVFLGQLNVGDLAVAYASSDVFVFPSTTETFGLVVLEAMASGLPAVGADAPGIKDIIKNNNNGFLTIPRNAKDFSDKILTLIEDKTLRKKMGTNAAKYAKSRSWQEITDKLIDLYRKTINSL